MDKYFQLYGVELEKKNNNRGIGRKKQRTCHICVCVLGVLYARRVWHASLLQSRSARPGMNPIDRNDELINARLGFLVSLFKQFFDFW